jgi:hypothetical protein
MPGSDINQSKALGKDMLLLILNFCKLYLSFLLGTEGAYYINTFQLSFLLELE